MMKEPSEIYMEVFKEAYGQPLKVQAQQCFDKAQVLIEAISFLVNSMELRNNQQADDLIKTKDKIRKLIEDSPLLDMMDP